jgi:exopolysaccharide biosynthesis polyprenyl glycosylphosphotransferase
MSQAGTLLRRHFQPLVLSVQVLADLATVVAACLLAFWLREQVAPEDAATQLADYRGIFAITAAVCLVAFHRFGMYSPIKSLLNVEEFKAVTKATLVAFLVVLSLLVLLRDSEVGGGVGPLWDLLRALHRPIRLEGGAEPLSRVTLLLAFGLIQIGVLLGRFVSFKVIQELHRRGIGNRNVVVIGTGSTAQALQRKFLLVPTLGLNFVGFIGESDAEVGDLIERSRVLGTLSDLERVLGERKVGEVFVALPEGDEARVMDILGRLERAGVAYFVVPRFYHLMRYKVRIENLDSIPLIARMERRDPLFGRLAKRVFDLIISALVLLLAGPLFLVTTWLIRRDSEGPVFFRQARVGLDGRPFEMLKFRTMYTADCRDAVAPATEQDPRVTRVGKWLRRYSLDELPNFINVLRGEMSVVGPRPEMPFIVEGYSAQDRERLRAKPGVTGLWQISYARQMAIHDNLDYDLYYIENQSFLLDLVIVALTGVAVVKGTGAY